MHNSDYITRNFLYSFIYNLIIFAKNTFLYNSELDLHYFEILIKFCNVSWGFGQIVTIGILNFVNIATFWQNIRILLYCYAFINHKLWYNDYNFGNCWICKLSLEICIFCKKNSTFLAKHMHFSTISPGIFIMFLWFVKFCYISLECGHIVVIAYWVLFELQFFD